MVYCFEIVMCLASTDVAITCFFLRLKFDVVGDPIHNPWHDCIDIYPVRLEVPNQILQHSK